MNLLVYQLLFSIIPKKLPIKRTVKKWFTFEFATCFLFPYKIFSRGLHSWKNHWSWFGPVCWADKWSVWCCKQGAIHRTGRSTVTIASVAVSFISRKVVVFLSFCNAIPLYDLNNYCYVPLKCWSLWLSGNCKHCRELGADNTGYWTLQGPWTFQAQVWTFYFAKIIKFKFMTWSDVKGRTQNIQRSLF